MAYFGLFGALGFECQCIMEVGPENNTWYVFVGPNAIVALFLRPSGKGADQSQRKCLASRTLSNKPGPHPGVSHASAAGLRSGLCTLICVELVQSVGDLMPRGSNYLYM